jgi:hypothetical protein
MPVRKRPFRKAVAAGTFDYFSTRQVNKKKYIIPEITLMRKHGGTSYNRLLFISRERDSFPDSFF